MPNLEVKQAGTWKNVKQPFTKQTGSWKSVKKEYTKQSGTWKLVWPSAPYAAPNPPVITTNDVYNTSTNRWDTTVTITDSTPDPNKATVFALEVQWTGDGISYTGWVATGGSIIPNASGVGTFVNAGSGGNINVQWRAKATNTIGSSAYSTVLTVYSGPLPPDLTTNEHWRGTTPNYWSTTAGMSNNANYTVQPLIYAIWQEAVDGSYNEGQWKNAGNVGAINTAGSTEYWDYWVAGGSVTGSKYRCWFTCALASSPQGGIKSRNYISTVGVAPTPPAAPTGLGATVSYNSAQDRFDVAYSWTAVTGAVSYNIEITLAISNNLVANASNIATNSVSLNQITGLHFGQYHIRYRLQAVNAAGTSAWSNYFLYDTPAQKIQNVRVTSQAWDWASRQYLTSWAWDQNNCGSVPQSTVSGADFIPLTDTYLCFDDGSGNIWWGPTTGASTTGGTYANAYRNPSNPGLTLRFFVTPRTSGGNVNGISGYGPTVTVPAYPADITHNTVFGEVWYMRNQGPSFTLPAHCYATSWASQAGPSYQGGVAVSSSRQVGGAYNNNATFFWVGQGTHIGNGIYQQPSGGQSVAINGTPGMWLGSIASGTGWATTGTPGPTVWAYHHVSTTFWGVEKWQ